MWQPIETAPKDADFLVWHRGRIRHVQRYVAPTFTDDWVIDPVVGRMWSAKYWMPLPAPLPGDGETSDREKKP